MDKIWYVYIEGNKEGPYSVEDLKRHPKVTPDTLAWKVGFRQWVPIRLIFELREIFKDEEESAQEPSPPKPLKRLEDDTVALQYEPPASYFWILIAILIIFYTVYLIYKG